MTQELDVRIVMCRPVELNDLDRQISIETGIDFSVPYVGSVEKRCLVCDRGVWLGPTQQEVVKTDGIMFLLACPEDAALLLKELAALENIPDSELMNHVHSLGNPENPGS